MAVSYSRKLVRTERTSWWRRSVPSHPAGQGEALVQSFTGGVFAQNGYLVRCARSGDAILVDPGAAVGEMLAAAKTSDARVTALVLTHAHLDHVEGLARAKRETGAPILLHPADEQ